MYIELMDRRINTDGIFLVLVLLAAAMMIAVVPIIAEKPPTRGNDLPRAKSYNFNIIAVPNEKNANFPWDSEGKRIFVLRTGTTWFYIGAGDFEIIDHDGTDGVVGWHGNDQTAPPISPTTGAKGVPGILFPYSEGTWDVEIYVRLLGPVDSSFKWKSYYYDEGGNWYVKFADFTLDRGTKGDDFSKFQLKTGDLLKDGYQDILWEWDTKHNLRIVQIRVFLIEA